MRKYSFTVVLLIFGFIPFSVCSQDTLDVAVDVLTKQIDHNMLEQKKNKIAILPFLNLNNEITNLGTYLAEELTTNIFTAGKFKIIERSALKQLLEELKLSQAGLIDPKSAKELGKVAGVDAIVTGTIADLGSYIAVNCRLIETESGEVFAVAKAKIIKDENIANLIVKTIDSSDAKTKKEPNQQDMLKDADALYDLGLKYLQDKNFESALNTFTKCVELRPDYGKAYYNLGITYLNLRDNYSARDVYKKLISIDPDLARKLKEYLR
jgi:TolB-like protein